MSGRPEDGGHIVALDALRGLAALLVVGYHIGEARQAHVVPHAYLAVDFFFVLSGFVIALSYEDRLRSGMSFSAFLLRRLKRIYPLYLVGLLIPILLTYALYRHVVSGRELLAFGGVPRFNYTSPADAAYPLNAPMWSLGFELAANLLHAAIVRHLTDRRLLALVVALGCAMVALYMATGTIGHGWQAARNPLFWAGLIRVGWGYFLGVLIYRTLRTHPLHFTTPALLAPTVLTASLALPLAKGGAADLIIGMVVLPLVVLISTNTVVRGRLLGPALLLGEISFPLYVIHDPILRELEVHLRPTPVVWFLVWCSLPAAALLTSRAYDRPVRELIRRMGAAGSAARTDSTTAARATE